MPMRGLTLVVATADPDRFRCALLMASAQAALGGRARLYAHEGAVRLLAVPDDALTTARELGVRLIACQTGLAEAGLPLPDGVEAGGLVSLMAALDDDRLVAI